VGDIPLSMALIEFMTNMFERSRTGSNILLSLLFGEAVRNTNFTSKDQKLEKMLMEIREIIS
jgi:hypothetical protein